MREAMPQCDWTMTGMPTAYTPILLQTVVLYWATSNVYGNIGWTQKGKARVLATVLLT